MPSKNYRFYRVDTDGRFYGANAFSAESDELAIRQVKSEHPYAKCEIWHGKRLVAMLLPNQLLPTDKSASVAAMETRESQLSVQI